MEPERAELIHADFATAASKLDAARALLVGGHAADSISRSYYAVFHAATALLRAAGLRPTSHHGLKTLLGLHFVKTNLLTAELGKVFERLQEERENSDYDNYVAYDAEDAKEALGSAERFVNAARNLAKEHFGLTL